MLMIAPFLYPPPTRLLSGTPTPFKYLETKSEPHSSTKGVLIKAVVTLQDTTHYILSCYSTSHFIFIPLLHSPVMIFTLHNFEELHTTTDAGRNFGFANFTELQNGEEEWHQPCNLFGKTP